MVFDRSPFGLATLSMQARDGLRRVLQPLVWLAALAVVAVAPADEPRAARSVHLAWQADGVAAMCVEMTVQKSTRGSYFMACGWRQGYFGVQELVAGGKVAIFSVWDPVRGDDPDAVPVDRRDFDYSTGDRLTAEIKKDGLRLSKRSWSN